MRFDTPATSTNTILASTKTVYEEESAHKGILPGQPGSIERFYGFLPAATYRGGIRERRQCPKYWPWAGQLGANCQSRVHAAVGTFRSLLEATVKAKLARIRWNHISRMTSRFVLGPGFKIARRDVKFNPLYGVRLNSKRVTITSLFPWKQRTRTDFETRNSDTLRVSSHLQRTGSRSKSKWDEI